MTPWIPLGVLLVLMGVVVVLPWIPAIKRIAGIDDDTTQFQTPKFLSFPSQFALVAEDEEESETWAPKRILTSNYRDWLVRPVVRTADQMSSPPLRPTSVSVMPQQGEESEKNLKRAAPRGIEIHFYTRERLGEDGRAVLAESSAAKLEPPPAPLDPAEREELLDFAVATGNQRLFDSYALEDRELALSSED